MNEKIAARVNELANSGLHCSQIMLMLSQELRGEEDPAAIKAVGGLAGGLFSGYNCGALTGGACVLSSYVSRGSDTEEDTMPYKPMVAELAAWFKGKYNSVNCSELLLSATEGRREFCRGLVSKTFEKCIEILRANGIDPRS